MNDLKRAFGSPDAQFHERVRQTLFRIEEKEEAIVKRKLTLSMALALVLCLTVGLVTALAASELLNGSTPDATLFPLSQSVYNTPEPTVYYHSEDGSYFGAYYHVYPDCSGITNPIALSESELLPLGKAACPQCLPEQVYTDGQDVYYHISVSCSLCPDQPDSFTPAEVVDMGLYPCPRCVQRLYVFRYDEGVDRCYHTASDCPALVGGGEGYAPGTLVQAESLNLTVCPRCMLSSQATSAPLLYSEYAPENSTVVYIGADGLRYHYTEFCGAAAGELQKSYEAIALLSGQTACPVCLDAVPLTPSPMPTVSPAPTLTPMPTTDAEAGLCWMSDSSVYYHADASCPGLQDAFRTTAAYAARSGKTACPVCVVRMAVPTQEAQGFYEMPALYAAEDDSYYHPNDKCAGLAGKTLLSAELTALRAAAGELMPCPVCAHSASRTVFFSEEDDCYHTVAACRSMTAQTLVSEADAIAAGRSACPECLYCFVSASDRSVFHMDPRCSSAADLESAFAVDAIAAGSTPCPDCVYWTSPEDALYHDDSVCTSCGAESAAPCRLEYALLTGRMYCVDWSEIQTASRGDVLTGEREVYFVETESGLYHLYPECPGEKRVPSMLLSDALAEGRIACESCLTVYTHSHPGQTSALYESKLTAPQKNPSSQTVTLTIGAEGFQDNLLSTAPISQDKWTCDSLTLHSLLVLRTRGGIYLEAEFSLTDPDIDPESIRMTYYCEGYGSFGWDSASVSQIAYEDGSAGYILQTVIPALTLPESAADAENGGAMSLRAYGKTMDGQSDLMFTFE